MVQLADSDISTKEVLDWQGIHLIHFAGSTCSQKTRIFLNLKGIDWLVWNWRDNFWTNLVTCCP